MDVHLWTAEILSFGKYVHAKNTQQQFLSATVSSYIVFLSIFLGSTALHFKGSFYSD